MKDLNAHIDTAQKYTAPRPDGIPETSHVHQVDVGIGMAQRAFQNAQQPVSIMPPMPPIIPVAN